MSAAHGRPPPSYVSRRNAAPAAQRRSRASPRGARGGAGQPVTAEANTRRTADDGPSSTPPTVPSAASTTERSRRGRESVTPRRPSGSCGGAHREPPQRWTEPADAARVGPVCPQPTDPRIPIDLGAPQGDDCLTLNVWASSDTDAGDGKPVMVWVHGGAYILGSSAQPLYHGGALAGGGEAVIVTVNYRLGALGFLDLSSFGDGFRTNLGLRDVLFALQWVRDNIAGFGGDPDRVTLFGESAGGGHRHHAAGQPGGRGTVPRGDRAEFAGHLGVRPRPRAAVSPSSSSKPSGVGPDDVRPAACRADRRDPGRLQAGVQRGPGAHTRHAGVRADHRRRRRARPSGQAGPRGQNAPRAADHRHQQARGRAVPLDEVAVDADHARRRSGRCSPRSPPSSPVCSCRPRPRSAPRTGAARKATGMGVARDIGFRMPSIWFAEGHAPSRRCTCTASTSRRRCCGCCAWAPRTPPSCPSYGAISLPAQRTRRSSWAGSRRAGPCRRGFGARWLQLRGRRRAAAALRGTRNGGPYRDEDRATLVIDAQDRVVDDPGPRPARGLGRRGAQFPVGRKLCRGGVTDVDLAHVFARTCCRR